MRSNAKLNNNENLPKSLATNANILEKQSQIKQDKASNSKPIRKKKEVIKNTSKIESVRPDQYDATNEIISNYLYTLSYNINEKGIGQILLPPSLSTLLQSDRVCIYPSAGGLFIKSL